jgi:DNA-directed RNA polymerase omega subunit
MMIDPPIDKLIEKVGCKYALCSLVTKRSRYLMEKMPAVLEDSGIKVVSYAAKEIFDGKVIAAAD